MLANGLGDITDKELVLQAKGGNQESFRQLYQRYQPRVRSTLYQLCGNLLLDDLVQEVFLRAWKGLPKLRQAGYFSTWIYRITWNVANDRRRQFAQQKQEKLNSLILEENYHISPDLMELHYQDLIWQSLQTLNFDQRAVVILHDLEDLPQKEIAQILAIPVGTVKSRLFKGRNSIRKFLQERGIDL